MTRTTTPQDRKLAIAVAVATLRAQRLGGGLPGPPMGVLREEARSRWAVSTDSMIKLADMIAAKGSDTEADVIAAWAEQDTAGVELDRALGRRLENRQR